MSRNRASKAELSKRRREIRELLIQGHDRAFIIERITKEYRTSNRAVQEDIRLIGKEWETQEAEAAQELKSKYRDRLEWLFCQAAGKNDVKAALSVQQEIHKLDGVYGKAEKDTEEGTVQFVNLSRRSPLKVVNDEES